MSWRDVLSDRARERIGQYVGQEWRLDELIGLTPVSAQYAASDREGAIASIKIPHGHLLADDPLGQVGGDDGREPRTARSRFVRHAYIANAVPHPGVIEIIDEGRTEDGAPYIVTGFPVGETVAERMKETRGRLRPSYVLQVVDQLLSVLEASHGRGIVHGDLCPELLFLTAAGDLKVFDFGFSRLATLIPDENGEVRTTPGHLAFIAPEQARATLAEGTRRADVRSELWSVGSLTFTFLTGRLVRDAPATLEGLESAANGMSLTLGRVVPNAPGSIIRLVDGALTTDPARRYASAAAMRAVVAECRARRKQSPDTSRPSRGNVPSAGISLNMPVVPASRPLEPASQGPIAPPTRDMHALGGRRGDADESARVRPPSDTAVTPVPDAGPPVDVRADLPTPPVSIVTPANVGGLDSSDRFRIIEPPRAPSTPRTSRADKSLTSEAAEIAAAFGKWTKSALTRRPRTQDGALVPAQSAGASGRTCDPDALASADAESEGSVSAGSVSEGSVSEGSVSAGSVSAGSVSAGSVSAGSVSAGSVSAGSVSAGSVPDGSVSGNPASDGSATAKRPSSSSRPSSPAMKIVSRTPTRNLDGSYVVREPSAGVGSKLATERSPAPTAVDADAEEPGAKTLGRIGVKLQSVAFPAPREVNRVVDPRSADARWAARDDADGISSFTTADVSPEAAAAMERLFELLEKAIVTEKHYGEGHPAADRRFETLFGLAASTLHKLDEPLVWNITPYSFVAGEHTLWEPDAPHDRIPYQLFADGVRSMSLLPGVEEREFRAWLKVLTLNPTLDFSAEDDFVTLLWEGCFTHIQHEAIDTFTEGTQEGLAGFENERQEVLRHQFAGGGGGGDGGSGSIQGEVVGPLAAWNRASGGRGSNAGAATSPGAAVVVGRGRRIMALLTRNVDAGSLRDVTLGRADDGEAEERLPSELLAIDDAVRRVLEARLNPEAETVGARFVVASARALDFASRDGAPAAVSAPLRMAVDEMCVANPMTAVEYVTAVADAISDEGLGTVGNVSDLISSETLSNLFRRAMLDSAHREDYLKATARLVSMLDLKHLAGVLDGLRVTDGVSAEMGGPVRQICFMYLKRIGVGHELRIGRMLTTVGPELGVAIARLLSDIGSPAAIDAISLATKSPHAVVRSEALMHVKGASGDQARSELKTLIDDEDPSVRIAALKAMEAQNLRQAGPDLVLRIRSPQFDSLPLAERRQAFATLCTLMPRRAEEVAVDLLNQRRLLASDAREQTRAVAAEMLGYIGAGKTVHDTLATFAHKRWNNSPYVRDAATKALAVFTERAAQAIVAR